MSHGVILGQTPALPVDAVDKSYVDNLNNSLINVISGAIFDLKSELKNYVNNAIAGIDTGNVPVVGEFRVYSSQSSYTFGPFAKKPSLILLLPLENRFLASLGGKYFFFGALIENNNKWRYKNNGIGTGDPQYIGGSGSIGTSYLSGSSWYVQCNKSSFMGPDFWQTFERTTKYIVFF